MAIMTKYGMVSYKRRRRKKTGAGDSLFARLNNITTIPTLMKILLQFHFGYSMV